MDKIPQSLQVFLGSHIRSIWVLELLLFMWKNSGREWDVLTLNRQLSGTLASTQSCLDEFEAKNILVVKKSNPVLYQFNSSHSDLKKTVDLLAQYYLNHRNKIVDFIYSSTKSISSFADAFIIRKEEKDGFRVPCH